MQQVVIIRGGDAFETYDAYLKFLADYRINLEHYKCDKPDWKKWLRNRLTDKFEVIIPEMPNNHNAQYPEWKLWFEKFIPQLNDNIILMGHSLGGSFLLKYLSENKFPKKINGVFLVSACTNKYSTGTPLHSFALPEKLDLQTRKIFLYHSKDDEVVPFSDFEELSRAFPNALGRVFQDRKHFNQEQFVELEKDILTL